MQCRRQGYILLRVTSHHPSNWPEEILRTLIPWIVLIDTNDFKILQRNSTSITFNFMDTWKQQERFCTMS
jgi:hypothetical protein